MPKIDLWTFQPWPVVRVMIRRDGHYTPDPTMSEWVGGDCDRRMRGMFRTAYRWMGDMMVARNILPPGMDAGDWRRLTAGSPLYDTGGWNGEPILPATPVWAYAKWCARDPRSGRLAAHGRPDLRRAEFRDDMGRLDLIHLRVDAKRMLLTDMDAYNDILNRAPIPPARSWAWPDEAFDAWLDRHADDPPARIAATWGRSVCGLHTLRGAVAPLAIQATLWDIGFNDITDVNGRRPSL